MSDILDIPGVQTKKSEGGNKPKIRIYTVGANIASAISQENTKVQIARTRGRVKKESQQSNDEGSGLINVNYLTPYVSRELLKMFYEQNGYFYKAVELKAKLVLGIGTEVVPDDPDNKDYFNDEEYKRFRAYLDGYANAHMETFDDVINGFGIDYYLFLEAYLECAYPAKNSLELYNLRTYNARLHYNNLVKNFIDGVSVLQLLNNGIAKKFKLYGSKNNEGLNEILWIKNYNPFNKFYGFPDIYPASGDLSLDRSSVEFNVRSFVNDLMVNFVIKVEGGELADGSLEAIQEFLEKNYKGIANANRALYINSDDPNVKISIDKLNKDVKEGSFDKMRARARDMIITVTGIPAALLGISTPGQLGNNSMMEDLFRFFNQSTIQPEKNKFAKKLNPILRDKLGITKFHLEFTELTYERFSDVINYVKDLVGEPVLNRNEGREYLGYEPEDDKNNNGKDAGGKLIKSINKLTSEIKKSVETI